MSNFNRSVDNMERLGDIITDSLETTLLEALKYVQADAKRLAPADSGQLIDSITVDVKRVTDHSITGVIGTRVIHGAYVEFGTKDQPARPFLYPSFKQNETRIRESVAKAILSAVGRWHHD